MNKKYFTYMGFAIKAGQCGMGTYACESEIDVNKTKLLICSVKASQRTKDKFKNLCEAKKIPYRIVEDDLVEVTGRAGTNVYSITNVKLAEAIIKELDANAGVQGLE